MSSVKISKIAMVEAISQHPEGVGNSKNYLKKASVSQLNELVIKYGIDINAFAVERKAGMKLQRIKDKNKCKKMTVEERKELVKEIKEWENVECCVKCCVKEPAGKMWLICECVGNYCGSCSPTNNCSNYPICSCPCGMCAVDVDDE
jgi:hypothetical protein